MKIDHTFFELLGSEPRYRIVAALLKHGELPAGELAVHSGVTQSGTSQHLTKLRQAGLVTSRPDKQRILYSVNASVPAAIREVLCNG